MSEQYLCVKCEENDDWMLPSGFASIAKYFLQYELRSVRPLMSKVQQDVLVGRLETALHEDVEWNELPKTSRIDTHHYIKSMPPHPHKVIPCAIQLGLKDKHRFSATVDGVLQFTCICFLKLRTRSELNDTLCDEIDYYTQWRKLNHLELLQLAYIRYRPVMASTILCRLLLALGVLCLRSEELKKLLCSKVMREGLSAATLSEAPTDNAFLIPYYGMLRQCSLYNIAWNDIIGLNNRRKLWSEESEPKMVYKDEERRLAFEIFDEHFETTESCSPAMDALVLSAAMANWILGGTPARQYPFSIGLNMVNNEISAPWNENSRPEVMMLLSTDTNSYLVGHRLSSESSAQRAHEKALEQCERRNEKRQKSKERRKQQHNKRNNNCLETEQGDSDLKLTLDDSKESIVLLGVFESPKHETEPDISSLVYNCNDLSFDSDGLSPLQRFLNEPIKRTPLAAKQNLPSSVQIATHMAQSSNSLKDLELIEERDFAVGNENEVDRKRRLFNRDFGTPTNYLENLQEKFWVKEMEKDFQDRSAVRNIPSEPKIRPYLTASGTLRNRHEEHENRTQLAKSPVKRERIVSNGFRRASKPIKTAGLDQINNVLSFLCRFLVVPSVVAIVLMLIYFSFVSGESFYVAGRNRLDVNTDWDDV